MNTAESAAREALPDDLACESKFQWLTRVGFLARGLLYILIGVLAIGTGRTEDLTGALEYVSHGFGRLVLIVIAAGLATYGLWRLSDAGVWIRIITHRIYGNWGHAVAVGDTVTWLDTVGIPYRDLCFLGAKPQVEADCYIDDAPHNVEALRATGAYVIVFDQLYNRHLDGPRAADWTEVEDLVAARVADSGLTLQAPLPGFEDVPSRLHRRLHPPE